MPLSPERVLTIEVTSHDGGVYYGLHANRDAMGDVDMLAGLIGGSMDELVGSVA